MSAYMVIDIHPTDAEAMAEYAAGALPILERFGGRVVAFDPRPVPLEGEWSPTQVIIVEFADKDAVRAYLDSSDYRPWKAIRQSASLGRSVAVDGVPA
ncbi:DUF1330 domain-containing protein [Saccharothrix hoggarensis]|uniref:DUF1330 domain-containing protein n=1 Tax=Saccharothrix hoggarensis TaxID=913853 RepID=A0ABW3R2Y9_9PSEU